MSEREEWQALLTEPRLDMLPPEALIASIRSLAQRLLDGPDPTALSLFVRFVRMNPTLEDPEVLMRAFEAYRDNIGYSLAGSALCKPTYDKEPFG